MAIEIRTPITQSWTVSTYVPNERDGQILGCSQAHYAAGGVFGETLRTRAKRQGLTWLVRTETELLYSRSDGSIGAFYPDVLLAPGVELDDHEPYAIRTVGRPPSLVVEITSSKTARKDIGPKRAAYAEMGVTEYLTFDPRPRKRLELHGYRLLGQGLYREIPPAPEGGLWLSTISLRVEAEPPAQALRGPLLRLITREGERLLHGDEEAEARDAAERARNEAERERYAAELDRDEAERKRNAAERERDAERQARLAAEAENARLRELLDRARQDPR